ncbi:MAG: hypothetical protein A3E31_18455 [Candidatus Rokubacteria bacterium RIFCSPHIGHO2_12_FULL_73_22]|nr:MAG: hypothetical protein A3D33_03575 [Candidatus Rokubacteria bacterium RIFCSPHIGHO2_02_FULL_73_26]OGL00862.1 MAG: hypothetical protein A3E31_18455 [Candidatus Rokubacteria bacterium RIFCSPHIGHO2_12_FULL_73_22]OGL08857.1 MAG: hypothetical protein A3I14_06660 [Candidatus Rokubacteria bacterium RIFCSPLOWO2_02_FULL_73_56]OGL30146.1 MAG: hypothetical protein A3G44_00675 [Candidatus Rokubacteria bacterium RIFCSPLOWO2_12_FULL_73_47]
MTADRLWLYPTSAFCRRPGQRIRVPAGTTRASVCETRAHLACDGYRAGAGLRLSARPRGG